MVFEKMFEVECSGDSFTADNELKFIILSKPVLMRLGIL